MESPKDGCLLLFRKVMKILTVNFKVKDYFMNFFILKKGDNNSPLLVCKVRTDVLPDGNPNQMANDNNFIAQCIGCQRVLESYSEFCRHLRLDETRPRQT